MPRFTLLWPDMVVFGLLGLTVGYAALALRDPARRDAWRRVLRDAPASCALIVLAVYVSVAALDSVHFRRALGATDAGRAAVYATQTTSLLDVLMARPAAGLETSYSAPLAMRAATRDADQPADMAERRAPRLRFGGADLRDDAARPADLLRRALIGLAGGALVAALLGAVLVQGHARARRLRPAAACAQLVLDRTEIPWRAAWCTTAVLCLAIGAIATLATAYHVFGTDRTGNDVLYAALKSVRTAIVIGGLSSVATLPLAIVLGIAAGALRGWVDDAVEYLYTVLSSIPNVLLTAACMLMLQVFIDTRPALFETAQERADARLILLCLILGLTNWTQLCRLLRAETMKLATLDHVHAAVGLGVRPVRLMARHVFPHVVHLIVITTVLDFSSLVLYEAVLSYVGVGVDPSMQSFGGMIALARTELAHDPLFWWPLTAAFVCMVVLVLAAHLLADGMRAAFDPTTSSARSRRRVGPTGGRPP